jgi:hypothetical protein
VTCLAVSGNGAVIGFRSTGGNFPVAGFFLVAGDGTPDTLGFTGSGEVPTLCAPPAGTTQIPVVAGGIVVVDAPALPTSTDQCKNGGWRNYPGFENQGACVSFVATGGKNPPSGP